MSRVQSCNVDSLDISVIVPTHDDGDLLERCLASIAAQILAPMEIIVVDDGSTRPEALAGIERALARHPTTRLVRQVNAGPSAARNRGVVESRGDWIAFVDADDELPPNSLAHRRALVSESEDIVAAYADVSFVEPDGRRHRSSYRSGHGPLPVDRIGDRDGVPGFLWAYLIRSTALRTTDGFDEDLRMMEDFDLLARLARAGGTFVGDDAIGYIQHRRRGSLARGSALRQMKGALRFLAKARRERYFSRRDLARRYMRVPIAALKVALLYRLRGR